MKNYDVIILGAGAAGLFSAAYAIKRSKHVAIIDMGDKPARKVAVSGGGRCNFTNIAASPERYFGQNKNFVRGALARFSPTDMLQWAQSHKLTVIEKSSGQFFCKDGANSVVHALIEDTRGTDIFLKTIVRDVEKNTNIFTVKTSAGDFTCNKIIIATGGTSFDALGTSDIGLKIAKKFGHKIVPVRPALCAITTHVFPNELMGISLPVTIKIGREIIRDDMLFTHFGIGGPAVYRATVRDIDKEIVINIAPDDDMYEYLRESKHKDGKKTVTTILAQKLPTRVAKWISGDSNSHIADLRDSDLKNIANRINNIVISPSDIKYHSLSSAEVVRGGVDTADISSKTMESKLCPGLYFAGEVMDIAGDLGGFNLQWAWSSGFTAGNALQHWKKYLSRKIANGDIISHMYMTTKIFTASDNTSLMCAIWDAVPSPIGVVQIIHGVFDSMQNYDKLAHFLNCNGYIVFGIDKPLTRTTRNFDRSVSHEIDIMRYLINKYTLPIFLIGYGYGGFVAQYILQNADIPTNAVCLIKSGWRYRWAIRFARKIAQIGARIYGANARARFINFFTRRHCGHTQKSPMGTYGFYVSLFNGLIKLDANSNFENPIMIICGANDCDAPNARFSRALYNAYHSNDLLNTTLMIYPDMQNKMLMEMNCGTIQNDILSFFNDTNLLYQSDISANVNGTTFCKSDTAI